MIGPIVAPPAQYPIPDTEAVEIRIDGFELEIEQPG